MKKKITFLRIMLLAVILLVGSVGMKAFALTAGDIAIIALNSDNPDAVTFVALEDITAGTVITFTDNAWTTANGPFATNEGYVEWTCPVGGITKGTTTNITSVGTIALSADGDQVIAFTGTWADRPTSPSDSKFLYAFSLENFITSSTTSGNTSYLPSALSSASVAMTTSATETDNAYFANGSTTQTAVSVSGTKTKLLALFTDASKYYKNNTGPLTIPTYTVTVSSGSTSSPTTQASAITFTSIGQTGMTANWTNGNGAKRVVKMNTSNSFTAPTDGLDPSANTAYSGSGEQVVYNGSSNSVTVTGLSASTTYWYRIYEYNGSGATTKFFADAATNNPNSQATSAPAPLITVNPATLTGFTYVQGAGPSTEQSFTVNGANLTNELNITASTNYEISKTLGSGYTSPLTYTIGEAAVDNTIYVRLKAGLSTGNFNNEVINITSTGATAKTVTCSGSVTAPPTPEPTNHATSFTATTNSTSQITITWTDATGGQVPDGYLVKASTGTPTAPADGTAEADATLVKNIAQGTQTAVFTGLSASTTYNFSVWPYTNSGATIDYKIGSEPTASATTETPLGVPVATSATDVSTTGFAANWGAAASATGYDVSVYTKSTVSAPQLVTNGGFENALSTDDWGSNVMSFTVNNTGGHNDAKYLSRTGTTTLRLEQTVTTEIGKQYLFSFWYKGYTLSGNGIKNYTIHGTSGTNYIEGSGSGIPAALSSATEWTQYTKIFTATANSVTISIRSYVAASFDDISLKAVDDVITTTPISGSPFTVTVTSKAVSGLNPATTYYYTVVAKKANETSSASNEISVTTDNHLSVSGDVNASTLPVCPTCDIEVTNGNTLNINDSKTFNSVTVAPGAKLTLNNGSTFSPGTFVLQSSGSATATFVDARSDANKTYIPATVQQYLPQGRNWYVGIPIVSGSASTLTAAGLSTSVSYWDETAGDWVNNYTGTLTPGIGYIGVSTPAAGSGTNNVSFTGNLNTGNFPVTVTRTVTAANKPGFNLIANPYPSYLNPCALITGKTKLEPTIWYRTAVWNGTKYVYSFETVNTADGVGTHGVTGYIPPMQAFWVRVLPNTNPAEDNSETLTFTNDMRYHANPTIGEETIATTPLKAKESVSKKVVRLRISNGITNDEAVLYSNAIAQNSFDKFDSRKMSNDNVAIPEIFTVVDNEQLVINGYNQLPMDVEIPLGFKTGTAGNFTLKANEITNLDANTALIVKDKVLNLEYDLTNGDAYEFNSAVYNSTNRFSIIFKAVGVTTSIDNSKLSTSTNVFVNANGELMVKTSAPLSADAKVSVYNAVGQLISIKPLSSGTSIANAARTAGVYWVKITNDGETITRKVIVN